MAQSQERKLLPGHAKVVGRYKKLIGKVIYMQTRDGWFCHVVVRDVKWVYGRIDLLVEQGDRVTWVVSKRCYLPPGTERARWGSRTAHPSTGAMEAPPEGESPGGAAPPPPTTPSAA